MRLSFTSSFFFPCKAVKLNSPCFQKTTSHLMEDRERSFLFTGDLFVAEVKGDHICQLCHCV